MLPGLLRSQKDRTMLVMLSHATILDAMPANAGAATRQAVLSHGLAVTAFGMTQAMAFVRIDATTVAGAHP
jgi:DNA-binding FadR family transcriptional regulator